MNEQCNNCGGFDKLLPCSHCLTIICENCQMNHSGHCEELQKVKKRGEGPTIANAGIPEHRAGHIAPPPTPADRPTITLPTTRGEVGQILQVKKDGRAEWSDAPAPAKPFLEALPVYEILVPVAQTGTDEPEFAQKSGEKTQDGDVEWTNVIEDIIATEQKARVALLAALPLVEAVAENPAILAITETERAAIDAALDGIANLLAE